ncbi:MAG: trypsin-like serine protease [Blastocatellia bacterium]
MRKIYLVVIVCLIAFTAQATADTIKLKNGDRLTGAIVKSDEKTLVIKTEYASTISNNIAAIRLSAPLSFNQNIQAINLDDSGYDWTGQVAAIAGWGITANRGPLSPVLNYVINDIITNDLCASVYGSDIVTPGVGCFSGLGGRGPCRGDSGDSVIIDNTLVGLASFSAGAGCDAGFPSGFVRIAQYRNWIRSNTGI